MRNSYYRLIDHTADLGMEVYGDSPGDLFANAARALFAVLMPAAGKAAVEGQTRTIDIEGSDWADLMVNWLRELLYLWNGEQQVVCRVRIHSLGADHLQATVGMGAPLPGQIDAAKEIKAVTYHQIEVAPDAKGWHARVIFDV